MFYTSTRAPYQLSSAQAIVAGIAPDGGLYVPSEFPQVTLQQIETLRGMSYAERAAWTLGLFLTDFTPDELRTMCAQAYAQPRFDTPAIAPLTKAGGAYVLELFHGPTQAFKDMALQMLPRLMSASMRKQGVQDEVVILVATSGDTGKAALEGFRDVPSTRVIVFYPNGGVSAMQRMQMVTQEGQNVHVAAVNGNFDDAQTGVKRIFADAAFAELLQGRAKALSSANSINFGRLVPQVAYYFSAYADLLAQGAIRPGDKVNFCVPTGNFGNILAADYARRMGLPIAQLICASNKNNVLTDFIRTGTYDANRAFYRTVSPSMDILISSNVERLLYELCGRDCNAVGEMMQSLKDTRRYTLPVAAAADLRAQYYAAWVDEDAALAEIHRNFTENGYLMDTHTAVAAAVYRQYAAQTGDTVPTVIVSTASPYKFAGDVLRALEPAQTGYDELRAADCLESFTGVHMPEPLRRMRTLPERHLTVCEKAEMQSVVDRFLVD